MKIKSCMKQVLIFLLMFAAVLLLVGCSLFDSAPVKPKILGITHVVQEKGGLTYAEIGDMRYPVSSVFTGETHPRVGGDVIISPVNGMLVTVVEMTGDNLEHQGVQFMLGEWDEAQIEDAFRKNYTFAILALSILFICVIGMFISMVINDRKMAEKYGK